MSRGYILFVWQEYSFQITMRQQWNDKRLAYKERLQGQLAGDYYYYFCFGHIHLQHVHILVVDCVLS